MGTKKKRIILIIVIVAGVLIASGAYLGWRYWQEQQSAPAVEETQSEEALINPEVDWGRLNNYADDNKPNVVTEFVPEVNE